MFCGFTIVFSMDITMIGSAYSLVWSCCSMCWLACRANQLSLWRWHFVSSKRGPSGQFYIGRSLHSCLYNKKHFEIDLRLAKIGSQTFHSTEGQRKELKEIPSQLGTSHCLRMLGKAGTGRWNLLSPGLCTFYNAAAIQVELPLRQSIDGLRMPMPSLF